MANGAFPCIMPNRHSLRQVPILRKGKNPTNRDGLYNECLITHPKSVTPSRPTSTKAPQHEEHLLRLSITLLVT